MSVLFVSTVLILVSNSIKKDEITAMKSLILILLSFFALTANAADIISIEPALTLVYDAHEFNKKAKSITDLEQSGDLTKVPPILSKIVSKIDIKPTAIVINDVAQKFCLDQADESSADTGVKGMQCVHNKNTNKWSIVYREQAVQPEQKGFWQWSTKMEHSGVATRMTISYDKKVLASCDGSVVEPGTHTFTGNSSFCVPVFDGEIDDKIKVGPLYTSQGEEGVSIIAAGQYYNLVFAAGGVRK